jgi:hypothetical protein
MMPFRGQAYWALLGLNVITWGKLKALAYHPTKKVHKAEEPTYLSTNVCRKKGYLFPV